MNKLQVLECCRTCLKESSDMRPMSSQCKRQEHSLQFWEMLVNVTGDNKDLLHAVPTNLCVQCEEHLSVAYAFKMMCIETREVLSRCLSADSGIIVDPDVSKQLIKTKNNEHDIVVSDGSDESASNNFVWHLVTEIGPDVKPIISALTDAKNEMLPCDTNDIEETYLDEVDDDDESKDITKTDGIDMNTTSAGIADTSAEDNAEAYAEDIIVKIEPSSVTKKQTKSSTLRQCLTCNLTFDDHKSYQMHHCQVHRTRTVCTDCGKLIAKHAMDKHMRSHTMTKEHLCTECGKSFTLGENLKKHLRIHTGDKRYTCQHCGEQFIHWNSKRSHIRTTHTGEKKYECSICGKCFAQSSNMFRHVRQHTGELPHECNCCGKKFMTTPELRNHLVVHTKEKNEHCTVCLKSFGTRKALHAHQKTHTGERNYLCPVCQRTFTQAHVLRTHMKTHPDCPIPPAGALLSQKALQRPPRLVLMS